MIEWSHRLGTDIRIAMVESKLAGRNHKEFSIQVIISEQPFGLGHGFNKKKAEQSAAEKTCVMLEI